MVPKNQWRGGTLSPGMSDADFQKTVDWNKQWLVDKIENGYDIVDIGRDGRPNPSRFYDAELEALSETKGTGKRLKLKKLPSGETISEMRARIKC